MRKLLGTVIALSESSGVDEAKLRPITSVVGSGPALARIDQLQAKLCRERLADERIF